MNICICEHAEAYHYNGRDTCFYVVGRCDCECKVCEDCEAGKICECEKFERIKKVV